VSGAVASPVVDAARKALGPVGVCLPVSFTSNPHADLQREAVGRLAGAGDRAVWTNEVIGKDALVQLAMLLSASERMAFGTCIANIWARPAQTMHAAAAQLAQAHPGRFVLGLGVGYPEQAAAVGQEFGSPLATMREYVNRMGSPTWPPAPAAPYPRIVAANGPKMVALAGDIADGALPAMSPPSFTAHARQTLGPDKLLVVGVSVVGDRIDSAAIAAQVCEQLTAGADHVTLLLPIGTEFASGIGQLEQVAPTLTELG
jgi:probable F420-dependent oxidoreductase